MEANPLHDTQLPVEGYQLQVEEGNATTTAHVVVAPKLRRTFWSSDELDLIKRVGRDVTSNWQGKNQKGKLKLIEAAYKAVMTFPRSDGAIHSKVL